MKRCSQAGAVTSTTITLFACTGDKRLTSSNLVKIHNLAEICLSQTPIKREHLAWLWLSPSFLPPPPPHLGVHLRERRSQLVGLPPEDDGLRAGVKRGHLHRHPRSLQDLLQGVALRTYDVLVLRLLHLHGDGGGLPLLRGRGLDVINKRRGTDDSSWRKGGGRKWGKLRSTVRDGWEPARWQKEEWKTGSRRGKKTAWVKKRGDWAAGRQKEKTHLFSPLIHSHVMTLAFSSCCPPVKSNFLSTLSPACLSPALLRYTLPNTQILSRFHPFIFYLESCKLQKRR